MQWPAFLLFNALSGIVWATLYGVGGYILGRNIERIAGPVKMVSIVIAVMVIIAGFIIFKKNERKLADEAERALPEPLGQHVSQDEQTRQQITTARKHKALPPENTSTEA